MNIVITGIGPVSSIGLGKKSFFNSLKNGIHGFSQISLCDVSNSPSKIGAEIKDFSLSDFIPRAKVYSRLLTRPTQLAMAACQLALEDAHLFEQLKNIRIGIVVGTSVANLANTLCIYDSWKESGKIKPHQAFHLFNHSAACFFSSYYSLNGPVQTLSSGCNSGLDAIGFAKMMIKSGDVDAMLVVGSDSEINEAIMAGLNAANALTTKYNDQPEKASRPFDKDRDGNVIGEGACAFVLESEECARKRGSNAEIIFSSYASRSTGNERAYSHIDPKLDVGASVRALTTALENACLDKSAVDLINANGSSSKKYDAFEAAALCELFGDDIRNIKTHSIKSMIGQHGASCSALQLASACFSIEQAIVPPTINHEEPDQICDRLNIVTKATSYPISNVLIHCIGFGGFYYSAATVSKRTN